MAQHKQKPKKLFFVRKLMGTVTEDRYRGPYDSPEKDPWVSVDAEFLAGFLATDIHEVCALFEQQMRIDTNYNWEGAFHEFIQGRYTVFTLSSKHSKEESRVVFPLDPPKSGP